MKRIDRKHWCGSSNTNIHQLRNKAINKSQNLRSDQSKTNKKNESKQNIEANVFSRLFNCKSKKNTKMHNQKQVQSVSYTKQAILKIKERMKNHKNIYSVYKFLDQNNQSAISYENLQNLLPYYGIKPQKIDISEVMSMFTQNKQQTISLSSFIKFIKEDSPPKKSNLNDFQTKNPFRQMRQKIKKSNNQEMQAIKLENTNKQKKLMSVFQKTNFVDSFRQTQTVQAMRKTGCRRFTFKTQKNKYGQNHKSSLSNSKSISNTFDWYYNDDNLETFVPRALPSKNLLIQSFEKEREEAIQHYQRKLDRIRCHQQKDLHRLSQGKNFYNENISQIFSRAQSAKMLGLRSQ